MNRMKYLLPVSALILLASLWSCSNDKVYEGEMYKHVFALISSDGYNIRAMEHDLEIEEDVAYISVSCGGTTPTGKELIVYLKEDLMPFDRYNHGNFVKESEYANLLPSANYTIESLDLKLPAGEKSAHLPFKLRVEGLSPDSTYFIPIKVDGFSDYEINPEKADVLYRPYLKNFWATQRTSSNYRVNGKYNGSDMIGTKRLFPLTYNRVRTTIGNVTSFTADTAKINTESIVLEIDKARGEKLLMEQRFPVRITPFKRGTILPPTNPDDEDDEVGSWEYADPDYPNIFFVEFDGYKTFKTFRLHYRYILPGSTTIREMKEELRLEFVYEE